MAMLITERAILTPQRTTRVRSVPQVVELPESGAPEFAKNPSFKGKQIKRSRGQAKLVTLGIGFDSSGWCDLQLHDLRFCALNPRPSYQTLSFVFTLNTKLICYS